MLTQTLINVIEPSNDAFHFVRSVDNFSEGNIVNTYHHMTTDFFFSEFDLLTVIKRSPRGKLPNILTN